MKAASRPYPVAGGVGRVHAAAGTLGRAGGDFSGRSLSFVTETNRRGPSLPAIMVTEHRAMGYFRKDGAANNPAARLLEEP